jgi:hypothetical protein
MKVLCVNQIKPHHNRSLRPLLWNFSPPPLVKAACFTSRAVAAMLSSLALGVMTAAAQQRVELELKGQWRGFAQGGAIDVTVAGKHAYVATGPGGLAIVNVSNPTSPARVGGYDTSGNSLFRGSGGQLCLRGG